MRILAFLEDPPVVERILRPIGEPIEAPNVLPVRGPPQRELEFSQVSPVQHADNEWPEMDQTGGVPDTWD